MVVYSALARGMSTSGVCAHAVTLRSRARHCIAIIITYYTRSYDNVTNTGMSLIPATAYYSFYATGVEIEGQQRPGVDFQVRQGRGGVLWCDVMLVVLVRDVMH
jgi:hypothetical protein